MIHFLRNSENRTIIETEVYNKTEDEYYTYTEVSSAVDIAHYSLFLIQYQNNKLNIISTINDLSELRGWLWENYYMVGRNDGTKLDDINEKVSEFYNNASEKLGLNYIVD